MTYYPEKNTLSFAHKHPSTCFWNHCSRNIHSFQISSTLRFFHLHYTTTSLVITLTTGIFTQAVAVDQLGAQRSLTFLTYFVCSVL